MRINVLLLGSGGREHALGWKIARSPLLGKLYVSPGNPGIASFGECISFDSYESGVLIEWCKEHSIDLVVVGPEKYLVEGIADALREEGIFVFGPSKLAAQLEGSKSFTKEFCTKFGIPTASFRCFTQVEEAEEWVKKCGAPIVIKADGLAAGKGVTVAMNIEEALEAIRHCFSPALGAGAGKVVIEEFLEGQEVSFFAICDGLSCVPFSTACDYKRVGDNDVGPNTGGMGAFSPAPFMNAARIQRVLDDIIFPTLQGMVSLSMPFSGVLFAGLMLTKQGPKLIEYNVRFGDPECQTLMMRLETDLLTILFSCAKGDLSSLDVYWSEEYAVTVVFANKGYPNSSMKKSILPDLEGLRDECVEIFHAGTMQEGDKIFAHAGRVLNIVAKGKTLQQARKKAYQTLDKIDWPEGFYRSDIGLLEKYASLME